MKIMLTIISVIIAVIIMIIMIKITVTTARWPGFENVVGPLVCSGLLVHEVEEVLRIACFK